MRDKKNQVLVSVSIMLTAISAYHLALAANVASVSAEAASPAQTAHAPVFAAPPAAAGDASTSIRWHDGVYWDGHRSTQ